MARWGSVDFKELKKLEKRLEKYEFEKFCTDVAKELAARLLAKVIKRTPVGVYPSGTGKTGGTLRRGWTGEKSSNAKAYADSLPVTRMGDSYEITIINPVHYASYVEYGHRTRGGRGWVKGRFMLTKSEIELEAQAQGIVDKKIKKYLMEVLGDGN